MSKRLFRVEPLKKVKGSSARGLDVGRLHIDPHPQNFFAGIILVTTREIK